jgi:hypothetical protein
MGVPRTDRAIRFTVARLMTLLVFNCSHEYRFQARPGIVIRLRCTTGFQPGYTSPKIGHNLPFLLANCLLHRRAVRRSYRETLIRVLNSREEDAGDMEGMIAKTHRPGRMCFAKVFIVGFQALSPGNVR